MGRVTILAIDGMGHHDFRFVLADDLCELTIIDFTSPIQIESVERIRFYIPHTEKDRVRIDPAGVQAVQQLQLALGGSANTVNDLNIQFAFAAIGCEQTAEP